MYDPADSDTLPPPGIIRFERYWLAGLAVSVVIAVLMFDYSSAMVGAQVAALINLLLFSMAILLMCFTSRRRSNVARWPLVLPFNLLILFYDVAHFGVMARTWGAAYLAPVRLILMAWATYELFTPGVRAWFAGRPDPTDDFD